MKKRLLFMSFAVLFCGLFAFAQKPVNVADKYMANYTDPYYYVNKTNEAGDTVGEFLEPKEVMKFEPTVTVRQGVGADAFDITIPRYHVLGAPWKTEGTIGTLGTDATGWHVDLQKGRAGRIKGTLTLTSGWGDFAATFDNMKVYQTTKAAVPAGKYDLVANWGQDRTGAKYTFLVLTKGTSIPDTLDLVNKTDANVIGYANLADTLTVPFVLTEPTVLTFGFVASFPAHEDATKGYASAMGDFELIKWVDGTNYRSLQAEYNKVKNVTVAQYPVGTAAGQYTESAWNAFDEARKVVKTIIDNIPEGNPVDNPGYKDNATQAEVDAAKEAMVKAYEKLQTAMIIPFKYSTDAKSYYYRLSDFRKPLNYWNMAGDFLEDGITPAARLMITKELDEAAESMMFKFVKSTAEGKEGFLIYNKANPENALSVFSENRILSTSQGTDTTWVLRRSTAPNADQRFVISIEGVDQQLNSYEYKSFVGFYNNISDIGNAWKFERVYMEGETNFAALSKIVAEAKNMTSEKYPIGTGLANFSQASWDAFVAARNKANEVLAKEEATPQPAQADVDAAVQTLKDAIAALDASMTDPILFSTDTEEHYYIVHDKREAKKYWVIEDADVNGTPVPQLKISSTADNESDKYKFKFVKKAADSKDFYIYSKTNAELALSISPDQKNFIQLNSISENEGWKLGRTPAKDPDYFTVARATATVSEVDGQQTEKFEQLNSYENDGYVGFWNPTTDDPGNDWKFITEVESGINSVTIQDLGLLLRDGRIVSTNANAVISVYNISGQRLNSKNKLAAGIYIVTVQGKTGAAKIIVR